MATSRPAHDLPTDNRPEEPNHMIFWLDATICTPGEYVHLKTAFASGTDPRCERPTMLNDADYNRIIAKNSAEQVRFEGVKFLLQVFTNEADCLRAFQQNQDARIFFITSGAMGQSIVPKIMNQYRRIFTDLITDEPFPAIYVFCHNMTLHVDWAFEYRQYLRMFDFDSELLERLTHDIAEYFIVRGNRLREAEEFKSARQRLLWAKKLYYHFNKMEQKIKTDDFRIVKPSQRAIEVDKMIAEIEPLVPRKSIDDDDDDDDDDKISCEQCT